MTDLRPATSRLASLLEGVSDRQLGDPTPCPAFSLGDLIDHIGSFAVVFGAMGRKAPPVAPAAPSADALGEGWRLRIAEDLGRLADAWRSPGATEGVATAGGVELPTATMLLVALDELVVHGWDVAVASGQPYQPDPADVDTALAFVAGFDAPRDGRGPFGPVVAVAADAPALDRLLGLAGRDPGWTADGSR